MAHSELLHAYTLQAGQDKSVGPEHTHGRKKHWMRGFVRSERDAPIVAYRESATGSYQNNPITTATERSGGHGVLDGRVDMLPRLAPIFATIDSAAQPNREHETVRANDIEKAALVGRWHCNE